MAHIAATSTDRKRLCPNVKIKKKVIGQDKNNVESVSNEISENIDLIPILCEENNILKTKIQQLEVTFPTIRVFL